MSNQQQAHKHTHANTQDALDKLRKRAYASTHEHLRPGLVEIGGWKIIQGEKRFVPISVMRRKPRHCTSCSHFGKVNFTCSQGYYCQPQSDASNCEAYINRTWKHECE